MKCPKNHQFLQICLAALFIGLTMSVMDTLEMSCLLFLISICIKFHNGVIKMIKSHLLYILKYLSWQDLFQKNNLGIISQPNNFSCLINVVSVLGLWICQDCLTIKAVKASINVSNVSCKNCTLLWYAKKENYLHEISCLLSQFSQPYLICAPKLDVPKVKCAVQVNLKYPLVGS